MSCFPNHRALRVRHEPTAILDDDPLNGLANHSCKASANTEEPTPPPENSCRVEETNPLAERVCKRFCETVARLLRDRLRVHCETLHRYSSHDRSQSRGSDWQ